MLLNINATRAFILCFYDIKSKKKFASPQLQCLHAIFMRELPRRCRHRRTTSRERVGYFARSMPSNITITITVWFRLSRRTIIQYVNRAVSINEIDSVCLLYDARYVILQAQVSTVPHSVGQSRIFIRCPASREIRQMSRIFRKWYYYFFRCRLFYIFASQRNKVTNFE